MPMNAMSNRFDVVTIGGKEALLVKGRLDHDTVPDGVYLYDVGYANGDFSKYCIAHHIQRDRMGTLMLKEPLGLEDGIVQPLPAELVETTERKNLLEYLTGQPFELRAVPETETALFYTLQPAQNSASGCIGHISGRFNAHGQNQWHVWLGQKVPHLDIWRERGLVMALLDEPMLTAEAIRKYCGQHPDAALGSGEQFGFRADTPSRAYYMRFAPDASDFNVHLHIYDKAQLERYLSQPSYTREPTKLTTIKFYSPLTGYIWVPEPGKPSGWEIRQEVKLEDDPHVQELIRSHYAEQHPDYPGGLIHFYPKDDPVKRKIQTLRLDIEQVGNTLWTVGVCEATGPLTAAQERSFKKFWQGYLKNRSQQYQSNGIEYDKGSLRLELHSDDPDWGVHTEVELDSLSQQMTGPTM